jgi:hypothetical protein
LRTEEDAAAAAIYLKFFRLEAVEKGKQLWSVSFALS